MAATTTPQPRPQPPQAQAQAQTPTDADPSFPLPPILAHAQTPPALLTQGAEARLYRTSHLFPSRPAALKYRPPKPWRHPTLDARLTRARILAEARVLYRCHREGVSVPAVLALDEAAGWLMLEWICGAPVRVGINEWLDRRHPAPKGDSGKTGSGAGGGAASGKGALGSISETVGATSEATTADSNDEGLADGREQQELQTRVQGDAQLTGLMRRVGTAVGKLHKIGIVHGDLTTSNMMLRPALAAASSSSSSQVQHYQDGGDKDIGVDDDKALEGDIVLIDFGLASQSTSDEDRAVDLYVLERAFGSTHPRAEVLFPELLRGYQDALPTKQATVVLRKLEDVRMRGRKRSMVG